MQRGAQEQMGRDVGDAATSQGTPRTVRNQQQLGEAREGPLLRCQMEHCPAHTPISGLWPPEQPLSL